MSLGENQAFQVPGYAPGAGYAGSSQNSGSIGYVPAGGSPAINTNPLPGTANYNPSAPVFAGTYGLTGLVNVSLSCLDEAGALLGRMLEGAQPLEIRQAAWQAQQLINKARACSYQIRGMVLQ